MLTLNERGFLLDRISCGYIIYRRPDLNLTLYVHEPSREFTYLGREHYSQVVANAKHDGLLTEVDVFELLHTEGLWTERDQEFYEKIPDDIEEHKVQMYHAVLQSQKRDNIRQRLRQAEEKLDELAQRRHAYDYITAEGLGTYSRWHFLIANCTFLPNGDPYGWEDIAVDEVVKFYQQNSLSEEAMRELARTEPWQSTWTAAKTEGSLFGIPAVELSNDQKRLVSWSTLYENIHESPDCPHNSVIEDDDMLDGWLILQRRKREKEQNKKTGEEKLSPKIANADEVYLVANTAEDAKKIDDMNSPQAKMIKRQRMQMLRKQGRMKQTDMPDTKRKLQMELNKKQLEQQRGGNG